MAGGARSRAGRKAVNISLVELEKVCGLQCTDVEIAAFFDVSTRTIERRKRQPAFAETMERGRARGRLSVRRMLFGQAAKGNVAAAIFLAKNVLGYRDVVANEHSGPNGRPIEMDHQPDFAQLSNEELQQLRTIAEKAKSRGRD
ncbi:MAG TPA: hypothetical protein VGH38_09400 [Bryobacteraceae bacterium]